MGNKLSAPLPSLIGLSDDDIVDGICDDPFFLGLEDLAEELFPDDDNRARKRRRIKGMSTDDWNNKTTWGKMIQDPNVRDINTTEGKEFRRRFRLPFPFFKDYLVPECQKANIFDSKLTVNGVTKDQIPIEIKIMIALRLLGRGNVVDDLAELSNASGTSVRLIFKTFVTNFAKHFRTSFIRMPTGDELNKVLDIYRRLGFPGCIGSMDCTHVRWLCCPAELTNLCTGKEGFPTLSFQIVVDHARKINHVSVSGFGTMNDINICQVDVIVRNNTYGLLDDTGRNRNLYKDVEFTIFDENGQPIIIKGAFLPESPSIIMLRLVGRMPPGRCLSILSLKIAVVEILSRRSFTSLHSFKWYLFISVIAVAAILSPAMQHNKLNNFSFNQSAPFLPPIAVDFAKSSAISSQSGRLHGNLSIHSSNSLSSL
jgi:hypothetical protein